MEKSNNEQKIVELGKVIVKELELEPGVDTLSKWMAHYLSELFNKLENAEDSDHKKQIEQECVDVILKLWQNKSSLPVSIDPMKTVKDAISVLDQLKGSEMAFSSLRYMRGKDLSSSFGEFANEIDRSAYQMIKLSIMLSLANKEFINSKKWNTEFRETLSKEESKLIDLLDSYFSRMERIVFTAKEETSIMDMSPSDRKRVFIEELKSLIDQQSNALNRLKNSLA